MKATATAQGHVTGFFKIYRNGSTGAGFNIENGMKTTVEAKKAQKNSLKIFINGKQYKNAVTSRIVVKKMLKKKKGNYRVTVKHSTKFPIGYGLGLSGSGALSLATALNKALSLKLSRKPVVSVAAKADIDAGTGRGDVIAQQYKGVMLGLPPYPSKRISRIKNTYRTVVFGFFGPLSTKKVVTNKNWIKKINKTGGYCMRQITKQKTIDNFLHLSRVFAVETGLASKKVRRVMEEFPNSSMAMLGDTAFIFTNKPKQAERKLRKFTKRTAIARISS